MSIGTKEACRCLPRYKISKKSQMETSLQKLVDFPEPCNSHLMIQIYLKRAWTVWWRRWGGGLRGRRWRGYEGKGLEGRR